MVWESDLEIAWVGVIIQQKCVFVFTWLIFETNYSFVGWSPVNGRTH